MLTCRVRIETAIFELSNGVARCPLSLQCRRKPLNNRLRGHAACDAAGPFRSRSARRPDDAQIAVRSQAKFCDHRPLYRQAEIYARAGLDIDRGLLADWLGHIAWLLQPLAELIGAHVMAGRVIHADDTPVDVLAPGNGTTKTGRLWVYLRDERPHGGTCGTHASGMPPPAVLYRYTPDRRGEHCRAQLAEFTGWLHADGYAGFGRLYEIEGSAREMLPVHGAPRVAEVACWAHVRRGFFDVHKATGSTIAHAALEKIGALFDIERLIVGQPPPQRQAVRQRNARPRIDALACR